MNDTTCRNLLRRREIEAKLVTRVEKLKEALYAAEQKLSKAQGLTEDARDKHARSSRTCSVCMKSMARERRHFCVVDAVTGETSDIHRCGKCQAKARVNDPASVYGPEWRKWVGA